MTFFMIFLTIHKISYYKVRVSTGSVETRWLGGSFLMVYRNKTGRLGSGFIIVCWETRCLIHLCVLEVPERPCSAVGLEQLHSAAISSMSSDSSQRGSCGSDSVCRKRNEHTRSPKVQDSVLGPRTWVPEDSTITPACTSVADLQTTRGVTARRWRGSAPDLAMAQCGLVWKNAVLRR